MKKILVINGHPKKESLSGAITERYVEGAKSAGADVRVIHVADMSLEQYMRYDHFSHDAIGEANTKAQEDISWAQHIVIVYPVWWGSIPAILKCFIDMVFASGFAFRYKSKSALPEKLLTGKTGHIITTMDTPWFIYRYFYGAPSVNQLKSRTLEFCGITPVKVTHFGPVVSSTEEARKNFLTKVYSLGKALL